MANRLEGVTQQTDLVLWRGGGSHAVGRGLGFVTVSMLRAVSGLLAFSSATGRLGVAFGVFGECGGLGFADVVPLRQWKCQSQWSS